MKTSVLILSAATLALCSASAGHAQDATRPMPDAPDHANPAINRSSTIPMGNLSKGHNSYTAAQASDRLMKAGYQNISELKLDGDGLWQGTATMNGQSRHVALDYKGNIGEM